MKVGNKNYGPAAIQPALDWTGDKILQSTIRTSDHNQRIGYSSFLNGVMNTAPTTNSSQIIADAPAGGSVVIGITAGYHTYVDGKQVVPYAQRTDTVPLPTGIAISSLTRSAGVVTAVVGSGTYTSNETVNIVGVVADPSFDGSFVITVGGTATFQYAQAEPNSSVSGQGTVGGASVYYYYIKRNSQTLALGGPYTEDTQQNRLQVCVDGTILIGVVYVNQNGADLSQSAAGATAPAQTGNSRLLTRL
jgi:hypothetical protein